MKTAVGETDAQLTQPGRAQGRSARVLQSIGATIVTAGALWFLFGVPAYLLFGIFFE